MRVACLQFAPQVGDVDNNLNRADAVLTRANPKDLDLLVLPELCFSGYNFRSLLHITPFLEPTAAGITSLWARTTALKYNCFVTAGYPEKADVSLKWPAGPEYYNSAITVNRDGETVANYRKSFLYYTDETWALEGDTGFYGGEIDGLGNIAMGICMDLNPYKFEAPWTAWEFSYHILHQHAGLVILSMAWLTREDIRSFSRTPKEPDMETLSYWLSRLEPVIRAESTGEVIVVLANRCGTEDEVVYAGTSTVLGINNGEVKVYGILGRGEKELLVVDTSTDPKAKLVSEAYLEASTDQSGETDASSPTALTSPDYEDSIQEFGNVYAVASPTGVIPPAYSSSGSFNNERDHRSLTFSVRDQPAQASKTHSAPNENSTPSSPPALGGRLSTPKLRASNNPKDCVGEGAALASTDLAEERALASNGSSREPRTSSSLLDSHPVSISAAPDKYQSEFTAKTLGARSEHVSPRPRSSFW